MKKIILSLFLVAGLMAAPTVPIGNPTFTGTQTDSSTATHSGAHTFNGNAFFPSLAGGVAIFNPTTGLLNKGTAGVDYQSPLTFLSPLSNSGGNVSIGNAAADGVTKGAATFNSSYFTASSGVITPADSGVTATSYGDSTHTVTITFDAKGRATAASSNALTSASVGLGSVTNDAQTKAAIVPNTVPSAGQIHVGNAGGTAFGVVSMGGDATIDSTGAVTLTNGSSTRSHLGLTIGTNVQAWSAQLDTFASNGSSFYLNASNLNAGTLPDARFPATLPALSGTNLTSLNASNISSGTLPAGRYSSSTTILTNLGVYPIGTIANSALDSGTWLTMNGQVVSQSTYATLFGIVGHQPEFNWVISNNISPSGAGANQICYGNAGTYVLVGNAGIIYTSTNLATWTSRTSGVATALNSVTWDAANSLFIAVGASNVILTSPDGTTWTSRTSGVTGSLQNIITANGEDVAVGASGWVTYSTNGTSWTASQPNSTPTLQKLWYTHSVWFSCASGNVTTGDVYSTDGTTWNYTTKPTTTSFQIIGFDSTYFYGIDGTAATSGEIWKTTNGASWTDTGFVIPTIPPNSAYISSSGLIMISGLRPIYTTNGFSTLSDIITPFPGPSPTNSCICSPDGDSSVPFGIFNISGGGVNYPMYTADGIKFSIDSKPTVQFSTTNTFKKYHWNSKYFLLDISNAASVVYASDPYDPSTQFQIPTRYNGAGSNLVIKALN